MMQTNESARLINTLTAQLNMERAAAGEIARVLGRECAELRAQIDRLAGEIGRMQGVQDRAVAEAAAGPAPAQKAPKPAGNGGKDLPAADHRG